MGTLEVTDPLLECHERLANLLGPDAEPIDVLRRAEEHRAYWRPERVRVILLAESHVYTLKSELDHRIVLPESFPADLPRGFVRLVYCLGYGENGLLDRPIAQNPGTPQFWKIFYSCINPVNSNANFAPILKSHTAFSERISNKLALLQSLKEAGVWLLDASVAALYLPGRPKPAPKLLEACIQTSWNAYVGPMVSNAHPEHIVCIGEGVKKSLEARLSKLGIPLTVIPQPNAHLPSARHFEGYRKYYEVVQRALHLSNYEPTSYHRE